MNGVPFSPFHCEPWDCRCSQTLSMQLSESAELEANDHEAFITPMRSFRALH